MTDLFTDPGTGGSTGDHLDYADLKGNLLLVSVLKETDEIETQFGPASAINADVAVLDGPLKGTTYSDTLIFPKKLKAQLRGAVGGKVLGRLGQGEKQPGKNAPWQLDPATDADKETARKYLAYVAQQSVVAVEAEEPF